MNINYVTITPANQCRIYKGMSQNKELRHGMVMLAMKHGETFRSGEILADEVITQVDRFENTRHALSEDTWQAAQKLFSQLDQLDDETRFARKQELNFGLRLAQDKRLLEKLEDENWTYTELYERCCPVAPYSEEREAAMDVTLRSRLETFHLSAKAMDRIAKSLNGSENWVCTAGALSRKSHALKCMTALELYLSQEDMSVEDAAMTACMGIQMQGVADAVDKSLMTEKAARLATDIIALSGTILIYAGGMYAIAKTGKWLLPLVAVGLTLAALDRLKEWAPDYLAELAITAPVKFSEGLESVKSGWAKLTAWVKNTTSDQCEDLCVADWDEEEDEDPFPDYLVY